MPKRLVISTWDFVSTGNTTARPIVMPAPGIIESVLLTGYIEGATDAVQINVGGILLSVSNDTTQWTAFAASVGRALPQVLARLIVGNQQATTGGVGITTDWMHVPNVNFYVDRGQILYAILTATIPAAGSFNGGVSIYLSTT